MMIVTTSGITWEQCANTLFRDVEVNDTSRRGRRVNLLCALQIFYDSSGCDHARHAHCTR